MRALSLLLLAVVCATPGDALGEDTECQKLEAVEVEEVDAGRAASATSEVKWALVGAGGIAQKLITAISQSNNGIVTHIAVRTLSKCQTFVQDHFEKNEDIQKNVIFKSKRTVVPKCVELNEAFYVNTEFDAVYVNTPTATRKEIVKKLCAAKKHVLAEKPWGVDSKQSLEMMRVCEKHEVALMDGTQFVHHTERQDALKNDLALAGWDVSATVKKPERGDGKQLTSSFSVAGGSGIFENIRMDHTQEPLGAIGDLGWYNVRLALWAHNYELPKQVQMTNIDWSVDDEEKRVPLSANFIMKWSDKDVSVADCGFHLQMRQWAEFATSKAILTMQDFVVPWSTTAEQEYTVDNKGGIGDRSLVFNHGPETKAAKLMVQHVHMVETFAKFVLKPEESRHFAAEAQKTQIILDALMLSAKNDNQPVHINLVKDGNLPEATISL